MGPEEKPLPVCEVLPLGSPLVFHSSRRSDVDAQSAAEETPLPTGAGSLGENLQWPEERTAVTTPAGSSPRFHPDPSLSSPICCSTFSGVERPPRRSGPASSPPARRSGNQRPRPALNVSPGPFKRALRVHLLLLSCQKFGVIAAISRSVSPAIIPLN